ncbi:MAG TPA: class I SAM-dependent methyltransferase [Thermoanaerobaculia bacterium]|nr:class I SAM-dependent methyltransferase [Thermoanaerobaculia bacterium]
MTCTDRKDGWGESDSVGFLDTGRFFVPDREEQIAAVCALVPPPADSPAHVVELCCGEGLLAGALLARFPEIVVHGYDGSTVMLERARSALAVHGERFDARLFDLADRSWRQFPWPVHAVVSSLAVHHLDGAGKRELFADVARALAPGGALVLADLVEPATAEARALAAAAWDAAVRRRSLELAGDLAAYEDFQRQRWNLFAETEPDPVDHPSPLFDQLRWLAEAGLAGVDVFWMKAGHAIYGGRKPAAPF